jgi:hypothetical protein
VGENLAAVVQKRKNWKRKRKMTEFSGPGSRWQKMPRSVPPCDLCDALYTETEKANAAGETGRERLIRFILREHKKACHRL